MTRLPLKRRQEVTQRFLKGESVFELARTATSPDGTCRWDKREAAIEDAIRCELRRYQGEKPLKWVP